MPVILRSNAIYTNTPIQYTFYAKPRLKTDSVAF